MDSIVSWSFALALTIIILISVSIMGELERLRHVVTKTENRGPPKFPGITLSSSIPQGSLVKVLTPNDPMLKSPWDGLTGIVIGVDELHEWYHIMFPLEGHMKFQVFRRHDLERISRA